VLFRQRTRLRPLSERECYLRLHGARLSDITVIREPARAPEPVAPPPQPQPPGPTGDRPALHLVFTHPRGAGTMTGEELRLELLRRMESRAGEAA
jgi:hypothetical protein